MVAHKTPTTGSCFDGWFQQVFRVAVRPVGSGSWLEEVGHSRPLKVLCGPRSGLACAYLVSCDMNCLYHTLPPLQTQLPHPILPSMMNGTS